MSNRFYTLMIVPEKTAQVRKIVLPAWMLRGAAVVVAFIALLATVMVFDYWYVMSQIGENKQLKLENRKLRQQVQIFKNKMITVENTMERVKTFATRLKVITNIEDHGNLLQTLNQQKLPDASSNIGAPAPKTAADIATTSPDTAAESVPAFGPATAAQSAASEAALAQAITTSGTPPSGDNTASASAPLSPEDAELKQDYEALNERFTELNRETLYVEQMLQDQYELLADQKAFLAALPTRKPAIGYFTSGFGIRKSPYGGRVKMHEGLDIANRPGTLIKAPADGVVAFAATKSGYGQTLILDHGYGLETWYGHTRKLMVSKGQHVRRGEQIALLGNSGRSTGPHVHYEVRVHGTPVDPLSYILEN